MKWFDDMRVSLKILVLTVIAAIALFSVGYTGYSMLDDSNYRMSKMYNQKLKNVQMLGELKYFMRDMQVHELNLADSTETAVQDKNRKTIESINDRFHQTMDAFKQNTTGLDGVEERVQDIEANWEKLYQTGKKIDALAKDGKTDEARALYYDEGQKNSAAVGKPVKELFEMTNTNAEDVYNRNLKKAGEATRNMQHDDRGHHRAHHSRRDVAAHRQGHHDAAL
ncbi:MCP four helix bundle domain-containing protein [uncultured Selenomonas sp.]|uniref:MCP four helix bundle domain-containing protein n=1 Tax=uncultured Selenomonas sp. TaxID=159275 RepID=UPI0026011DC9|nr:MCP four helix bundle domain-containing protein [uncultured Selenomonas sp.]